MTAPKTSNRPLIAMIAVYMLFVLATLRWFQKALMFGSATYRERGISVVEIAVVAGPLLVTVAMLAATIMWWKKGKRKVSYALFAITFAAFLFIVMFVRAPPP